MSPDWTWWDAWRSGDPDKSERALEAEAERSLRREPGRWSWGKHSDEVVEEHQRVTRHSGEHRRQRSGRGGDHERGAWSDAEWRAAREDYERQNRRREEREREEARSLRELAAERRRAQERTRERIRDAERRDRDRHDDDRGIFW